MLAALQTGQYDLAVGSRHVEGGDDAGLSGRWRHLLSDGGIRLAQAFLPIRLTDPMSGFFMLPRAPVRAIGRQPDRSGLQDPARPGTQLARAAAGHRAALRVPRARRRREQARRTGAGAVCRPAARQGVRRPAAAPLHLLRPGRRARRAGASHGAHRGAEIRRHGLRGGAGQRRRWLPWCSTSYSTTRSPIATCACAARACGVACWCSCVVCGVGAVANIGIAKSLYDTHTNWTIAGAIGAIIGVVWNYAVSATLVWRAR